jgi:hypothetical protein
LCQKKWDVFVVLGCIAPQNNKNVPFFSGTSKEDFQMILKRKNIVCLLVVGVLAWISQVAPQVKGYSGNVIAASNLWVKTWGGASDDGAGASVADGAGNLYVVGSFIGTVDFDPDPVKSDIHTSSGGSIDAFLSKFDPDGNFLWAKTWGGSGRDVAYGVGVDSLGNAYVVGPYRNTVDFNPDPAVTENHTSNAGAENNIYVNKFSADGTYQWVRTWGPTSGAEAYTVVVNGDYLYVVGDFSGNQTDFNPWGSHDWHQNHLPTTGPVLFDAFLSKFDLNGNFQWARTWGGEGYDDGPGVAVDRSGNVYVAGMYASTTINFDPAGGSAGLGHPAHDSGIIVDIFLSKFDANGVFQWVLTWGGQGTEEATGMVVIDKSDRIYVAGRFGCAPCDFDPGPATDNHSSNGALDAFVSQFDTDGNFRWAKSWGAGNGDEATGLGVDRTRNVYVAGRFHDTVDFDPGSRVENHTSNGQYDMFLSLFDPNGNFIWTKTWGGSGNDFITLRVDGLNQVYAVGSFVGSVDFDPGSDVDNHTAAGGSDAFVKKFNPTLSFYLPIVNK